MREDSKGKLIAIEGPDGCGKSTQTKLLSDWLKSKGYKTEITKEPTDSPLGKILRDALEGKTKLSLEAEALLFASDRSQHVSEIIKPNLDKGKIVVTERYLPSSLAYQTARGLSRKWVETINKPAIDADLIIFIDIPSDIGQRRTNNSGKSDVFEKDLQLQKKVRENYRKLAKEKDMPLIDGTLSQEEVHEKIIREVKKFLHTYFSREG